VLRIGLDVGGTKIEGIALDDGREVGRLRVPTPQGDYEGTIAAIVSLVAGLERDAGQRGSIGVGIPGSIAPGSHVVRNANSTWLIGKPFGQDLEGALARPVRIENDANCFAISEATDGAAAGAAVTFGVIVGTGVGAGLVVGGQLVRGANAIAGEWGHNPLPWAEAQERPGPVCYCGLRGCIETFLSGPALEADFLASGVPGPGAVDGGRKAAAAEIVALGAAGDEAAERVLQRYESRMARALAGVINLLDPHVIVLGGGLSNVERVYDRVPRLWDRFVFGARDQAGASTGSPVRTRLVRAAHGDSSGVRGAAWLWR
jgi:fructokinase